MMKSSTHQVAVFAATVTIIIGYIQQSFAINFIIIQPDDMHFYDEWLPPPYLPWSDSYPRNTYPGISTLPWINKLRNNGLQMTSAYTTSPKCGTSRYSTVTGRYASRSSHGRRRAQLSGVNNPSEVTIPNTKLRDVLKANGFKTGMVGKWHLTRSNFEGASIDVIRDAIIECGFDDVEAMYPDNMTPSKAQSWYKDSLWSHNMEYVAFRAVEFIEDNQNEDWFLYMNPTVPHNPDVSLALSKPCLITPDGDFSTTNNPNGAAESSDWCVDGMTTSPDANGKCDCMAYRETIKTRANGSLTNHDLGAIWVDDAIGAVYKSLERTGQLEDTFILFQLDHGFDSKGEIWEGGIRIPQFIHYPAGLGTTTKSFHGMVSTIDIAPTILDFAGISEAYSMDGRSWKEAVNNEIVADEWKANRCLFFENSLERAVRCGCFKYVMLNDSSPEKLSAESNSWWDGNEVLFNLCDDSGNYIIADESNLSSEVTNVISENQEVAEELRSILNCHMQKTNANINPLYQECTLSGDVDVIITSTNLPEPTSTAPSPVRPPEAIPPSSPTQTPSYADVLSTIGPSTTFTSTVAPISSIETISTAPTLNPTRNKALAEDSSNTLGDEGKVASSAALSFRSLDVILVLGLGLVSMLGAFDR